MDALLDYFLRTMAAVLALLVLFLAGMNAETEPIFAAFYGVAALGLSVVVVCGTLPE